MFHRGVSAYLVDHATMVAAATIVKPGQRVRTAEYKLNLLVPAAD
jgi:acyl-coenzyme A thioesterase PaaI-like protein